MGLGAVAPDRYDPTNGSISRGDVIRTCERPEP
jgi:hypothetical protein